MYLKCVSFELDEFDSGLLVLQLVAPLQHPLFKESLKRSLCPKIINSIMSI